MCKYLALFHSRARIVFTRASRLGQGKKPILFSLDDRTDDPVPRDDPGAPDGGLQHPDTRYGNRVAFLGNGEVQADTTCDVKGPQHVRPRP